ncbi:MAG: hypothetical protein Q7R96_03580 [Nanoarchaeota archaeon]|nr:hypothetical protein [Nanoarchaeota archaeon]
MNLQQIVEKVPPVELVEGLKFLCQYINSERMMRKVWQIGVSLMREEGVYIPFIPCKFTLTYAGSDNPVMVELTRQWKGEHMFIITSEKEKVGVGVYIFKERGASGKINACNFDFDGEKVFGIAAEPLYMRQSGS